MSALTNASASGIISRLRDELARRSAGEHGVQQDTGLASTRCMAPHWRPDLERLADKAEYTVQELLQYDDQEFVETAYRAILRRVADEIGLRHFTHGLRVGSISKIEVLGALRWSEEGKQRGVHVDGLLVPWTVQKWRRRRWVGPVLDWCYSLARLPRLARTQSLASSRSVREIGRLGQLFNQAVQDGWNRTDEIAHQLEELSSWIRSAESQASARSEQDLLRLSTLESSVQSLDAKLYALRAASEARDTRDRELASAKARVNERLDAIEVSFARLAQQSAAIAQQQDAMREVLNGESLVSEASMDALYATLEEAFRGSRELVKRRVEPYIDDLRTVASDNPAEDLVIDIGCGRGEWLELVRDAGFRARGIDSNDMFVQACRALDLDVVHGDAISVLRATQDASVAAITSMHLVEHLPFQTLIALLDECHRVLRPGGMLILETPNPENLSVGAFSFYMDPTHRNPIPPGLLFWLTRSRGFADVRVDRLTHERAIELPELLTDEVPGAASINKIIEQFRSPLDYAIVARRTA